MIYVSYQNVRRNDANIDYNHNDTALAVIMTNN